MGFGYRVNGSPAAQEPAEGRDYGTGYKGRFDQSSALDLH